MFMALSESSTSSFDGSFDALPYPPLLSGHRPEDLSTAGEAFYSQRVPSSTRLQGL